MVNSDVCQYQRYDGRETPLFFYKAFLKPSLVIFAMIAQNMKGRLMVLRDLQYSYFESERFLQEKVSWSLIGGRFIVVYEDSKKIFVVQRKHDVFSHIKKLRTSSL